MTGLPPGWDLVRLRSLEPRAELLDPRCHDVFYSDGKDLEELDASCIISFSGLCLVLLVEADDWYMGDLDEDDGSVVCWASYGRDLGQAIEAL